MMRNTQARQSILEFLSDRSKPGTAKEIVEHVSNKRPDVSKETVYRFIKTLSEIGRVSTIQVPGKGAVYEMKALHPHYHFACEKCDEVICVEREEQPLARLVPRGYSVSQEQMVFRISVGDELRCRSWFDQCSQPRIHS